MGTTTSTGNIQNRDVQLEYKNPIRDNYCMDVQWANMNDGAPIQMYDCNNTDAQKFSYDENSKQIRALHSGKCLYIQNVKEGQQLMQQTCRPDKSQQFIMDGDKIKVASNNKFCVDVRYGGNTNGTPVQIWNCNGTVSQMWNKQGCYGDGPDRALKEGPQKRSYTPETCKNACKGYKYYAIQDNDWCSCSNDPLQITKYGKSDKCVNGRGGPWANSIYLNK